MRFRFAIEKRAEIGEGSEIDISFHVTIAGQRPMRDLAEAIILAEDVMAVTPDVPQPMPQTDLGEQCPQFAG